MNLTISKEGYLRHAEDELHRLRKNGFNSFHINAVQAAMGILIDAFGAGKAAGLAGQYVGQLLKAEPLTPLEGTADEWVWDEDFNMCKNKRCYRVIKDTAGVAHDIEAIVFFDGHHYTFGPGSSKEITFPYLPVTEIHFVDEDKEARVRALEAPVMDDGGEK